MATPLRRALSLFVGRLTDLRIPTFLRTPVYRAFCAVAGIGPSDLEDVRLSLRDFPSVGAFFVRELREGARPFPSDPHVLPSPVDGRVQSIERVHGDSLLQAKGQTYEVRDLLAGVGQDIDLEGAHAWTIYLSPRDYHRIHAPDDLELREVVWVPGSRYSVDPRVLARVPRVLSTNERCVLRCETSEGPFLLVLVGALNVGRMRVVGVRAENAGRQDPGRTFARGAELARFEMGSTIVLLQPPGAATPLPTLAVGDRVLMGAPIGECGVRTTPPGPSAVGD